MSKLKLGIIIAASVVAIIIMSVFIVQGASNNAISLEEQVNTAKSDINIQEKRRIDLLFNLADCVKQYDEITMAGNFFKSVTKCDSALIFR